MDTNYPLVNKAAQAALVVLDDQLQPRVTRIGNLMSARPSHESALQSAALATMDTLRVILEALAELEDPAARVFDDAAHSTRI